MKVDVLFGALMVAAAGMATPAVAVAQDSSTVAAPAASAPVQTAAVEEKKKCRSEVPTGSIMLGKRVCHTKAEWAQIDAANRYQVEHRNDAAGGARSGRD